MSILIATTELELATLTTATQIFSRTQVDSNFAPVGAGLNSSAEARFDFAAQTEIWVHFMVNIQSITAGNTSDIVQLIDSGTGQVVLQLDMDGASGATNLEYWNGAAFTEILTTDRDLQAGVLYNMDIYAKIDNAAGFWQWYIDGVLIASFSGDTLNTGFTQIDRVSFHSPSTGSTGATSSTVFSEILIQTTDTRNMRVATLDVSANSGTNIGWTGTVLDVDEDIAGSNGTEAGDSNFISGAANGDREGYTARDLSAVADDMYIVAVVLGIRGRRDTGGPQNIQGSLRIGGTDYDSANLTGVNTAFGPLQPDIRTTDPSTAAAWGATNVNGMEIGVEANT